MSMLGPDDFDLDKRERRKKLAKDLSPAVERELEKWLDKLDSPIAFERIAELVGEEEAKRLVGDKMKHGRKLKPGDPWLRE